MKIIAPSRELVSLWVVESLVEDDEGRSFAVTLTTGMYCCTCKPAGYRWTGRANEELCEHAALVAEQSRSGELWQQEAS